MVEIMHPISFYAHPGWMPKLIGRPGEQRTIPVFGVAEAVLKDYPGWEIVSIDGIDYNDDPDLEEKLHDLCKCSPAT